MMTVPNDTPRTEPRFLSVAASAKRIGVSGKFVEQAIVSEKNLLPSYKVGRRRLIERNELDAWVIAQRS